MHDINLERNLYHKGIRSNLEIVFETILTDIYVLGYLDANISVI
jgi:hypothetical protein